MKVCHRSAVALLALVTMVACGSDSATNPTPVTTPLPQPSPSPTPTPTPLGLPFTQITAKTEGYQRNETNFSGIPSGGYKQDDIIYLDCTPRDANGKPTNNHPLTGIEWYGVSSVFVENVDYVWQDADTFDPAIRLRAFVQARKGDIDVFCRLRGVQSNTFTISILRG